MNFSPVPFEPIFVPSDFVVSPNVTISRMSRSVGVTMRKYFMQLSLGQFSYQQLAGDQ
jgi:hypothetical protein